MDASNNKEFHLNKDQMSNTNNINLLLTEDKTFLLEDQSMKVLIHHIQLFEMIEQI